MVVMIAIVVVVVVVTVIKVVVRVVERRGRGRHGRCEVVARTTQLIAVVVAVTAVVVIVIVLVVVVVGNVAGCVCRRTLIRVGVGGGGCAVELLLDLLGDLERLILELVHPFERLLARRRRVYRAAQLLADLVVEQLLEHVRGRTERLSYLLFG